MIQPADPRAGQCSGTARLFLCLLLSLLLAIAACSDDSDSPPGDAGGSDGTSGIDFNPYGPGCPQGARTGDACKGDMICNYNIANPEYYCVCKNGKFQCHNVRDMSVPDGSGGAG